MPQKLTEKLQRKKRKSELDSLESTRKLTKENTEERQKLTDTNSPAGEITIIIENKNHFMSVDLTTQTKQTASLEDRNHQN